MNDETIQYLLDNRAEPRLSNRRRKQTRNLRRSAVMLVESFNEDLRGTGIFLKVTYQKKRFDKHSAFGVNLEDERVVDALVRRRSGRQDKRPLPRG